ncbi:MAG: hypothetical protein JWO67_41, partial [Streptosporangiaceae bacterium]|nr:hypothetical protein [Streptosporangiaceae bacterium]
MRADGIYLDADEAALLGAAVPVLRREWRRNGIPVPGPVEELL